MREAVHIGNCRENPCGGNTIASVNVINSADWKKLAYFFLVNTHGYPAEGLELQVREVLSQLDRLQMVKKERDFPLLVGVRLNFLAGLPRPIPLVSGRKINNGNVKVCGGLESENG